MPDEIICRIALTLIPELGPVCAKSLADHFGNAAAVFRAKKKDISAVEGIGELRAQYIRNWNGFESAESEALFAEKNHIRLLFLTDQDYPKRLLHCYDPPTLLYYRGNTDLNASRIISVIGTRNHTEYGRQVTEELIASLHPYQVTVVSGLAFGIDAIAHKHCLHKGVPTVGVLAHGMNTIYPSQHHSLAKEMIQHGGLVTEFKRSVQPDKHNFPRRNRIVAGMSDATIVIETAVKGGSMITAELAHTYNRDVFAVPARLNDHKSSGCLKLLQQQKAIVYTGPSQLAETLGWEIKKRHQRKLQKELFISLSEEEKKIVALLGDGAMPIDELHLRSGLSSSTVAAAILNLELQNVINALPGKMYQMV